MSSAASLYSSVISDVISSIRESFLDEAVDEQVLQELKTLWEQKLAQSKTVDPNNRSQDALLDAKMAAGRPAGNYLVLIRHWVEVLLGGSYKFVISISKNYP